LTQYQPVAGFLVKERPGTREALSDMPTRLQEISLEAEHEAHGLDTHLLQSPRRHQGYHQFRNACRRWAAKTPSESEMPTVCAGAGPVRLPHGHAPAVSITTVAVAKAAGPGRGVGRGRSVLVGRRRLLCIAVAYAPLPCGHAPCATPCPDAAP
jgi:hypothetical protein